MKATLRLLLLLGVFFPAHLYSQSFMIPPPGSPLRKEILDILRKAAEAHYGQRIIFDVKTLRVSGQWAFFDGEPKQPGGSGINYKIAPKAVREAFEAGVLDKGVDALLKKTKKGWTIIEADFGATDVPWLDWDKRFGVPKNMLPPG